MAEYTSKIETMILRVTRFTLDLPTNFVQLEELESGALYTWRSQHPGETLLDDSIEVVCEGSERLVIQWRDEFKEQR